jgi:hypothetical protein
MFDNFRFVETTYLNVDQNKKKLIQLKQCATRKLTGQDSHKIINILIIYKKTNTEEGLWPQYICLKKYKIKL